MQIISENTTHLCGMLEAGDSSLYVQAVTAIESDKDSYRAVQFLKALIPSVLRKAFGETVAKYQNRTFTEEFDDLENPSDSLIKIFCLYEKSDGKNPQFIGLSRLAIFENEKTSQLQALMANTFILSPHRGQHLVDHLYEACLDFAKNQSGCATVHTNISSFNVAAQKAAGRNGLEPLPQKSNKESMIFRMDL